MMMENKNTALFPVTFFDGERELDMGTIQITPSLTFKSFQSILSHKLQISPHQITIYFERQFNNNNHALSFHRRRHPVTSKFDFGSILPESNSSFFWVVQKKSRRTRRRKPKNLLFDNNNNNVNELEYLEYVNRMNMMLQVEKERERYLMSMSLNSNVYNDLSYVYGNGFAAAAGGFDCNFSDGASSSGGASSSNCGGGGGGFCEVCFNNAVSIGDNTDMTTVPFHYCVNDPVTKVFKSPAGPIGPPKKKKSHCLGDIIF